MQLCATCGRNNEEIAFTSKTQCNLCNTARIKRRYHARFPRMSSDDLYILRCPLVEDCWKIGRTSCLARRVLEFNRHVPVPYEVEQVYIGAGCLEIKLHRMLSVYRVQGSMSREFFQCPLQVILDAADSLVAELRSPAMDVDDWE